MKKFNWYLLNIVSLGSLYFYSKQKAKKQAKNINKKLKTSKEINFDVNDLLNELGGKNNIKNVNYSLSSLRITVINKEKVNIPFIKEKFCKGIMQSGNDIILLFGDNSKTIAEMIKH